MIGKTHQPAVSWADKLQEFTFDELGKKGMTEDMGKKKDDMVIKDRVSSHRYSKNEGTHDTVAYRFIVNRFIDLELPDKVDIELKWDHCSDCGGATYKKVMVWDGRNQTSYERVFWERKPR